MDNKVPVYIDYSFKTFNDVINFDGIQGTRRFSLRIPDRDFAKRFPNHCLSCLWELKLNLFLINNKLRKKYINIDYNVNIYTTRLFNMYSSYKYMICKEPQLFKDNRYIDISYNLVILHAVFSWLQNNIDQEKKLKDLVNKMHKIISQNKPYFYEPGFFELFEIEIQNNVNNVLKGYILIDRSHGCFPLVFYPIGCIRQSLYSAGSQPQ